LKTVTIDMPDVIELVKTSSEGVDTGIEMNVSQIEDVLTNITNTPTISVNDVYVDSGSYGDNQITLTRTDGMPVGVDVSPFTAWYEGD
jgi:flavin-binding protein dodecin